MKLVSVRKFENNSKLFIWTLTEKYMENKYVGSLLIGISVLIIIIILLFNSTLKEIIEGSCTLAHGDLALCPMYKTVNEQTYLALGIVGILILTGFILIFSKPQKEFIIKKVLEKNKRKKMDTSELRGEEKKVLSLIEENKAIFQADLIEKTGFGKAKITRILDRLEGKGFVERKRRGMTNVVVLKE